MEYGIFLSRQTTACGTEFLAGGLCKPGFEQASQEDLAVLFALHIGEITDAVEADSIFAAAVKAACKPYTWAVGVSAHLPGISVRTGGILGSPHQEIASAQQLVENIGNGLWLYAKPGGPGMIAAYGANAQQVFAAIPYTGFTHSEQAENAANWMRQNKVETFMAVTDGSGPDATGIVLVETGRHRLRETLYHSNQLKEKT